MRAFYQRLPATAMPAEYTASPRDGQDATAMVD
jgi:hypothetical protein